jgi:hypothetical protein
MTVKSPAGARERYLDPESLLAIWPLWIVEDGKGHASIAEPPGIPVREPARARRIAPVPPSLLPDNAAQNDNQPPPTSPASKVTEPDDAAPAPPATTN